MQRAKKFYQKAFGWKISDPWNMDYFRVETKEKGEDGINGGLMARKMPGQPFMNYIPVDSIDAACKKVEKAAGGLLYRKQKSGRGWAGSRLTASAFRGPVTPATDLRPQPAHL